jgi:hypothetical protein
MPQVAAAAVAVVSAITTLTGTAAVVATTIAATAVVTVAATSLLTKKPKAGRPQGGAVNLDLATDAPRRLQIGQRGNGGSLVDWYTTSDGDDPNNILWMVIYLGEGPMGPITGIWSNGRKVFNGSIAHNGNAELTEFRSKGKERMRVYYHDGRPGQTANATLAAATGWPTTSVGVGNAYVILKMKWDPDKLQAPPRMFFETSGAKLYDRRKDTTAGGSGTHRIDDPDTWELSANPAVALDHYILGRRLSGGTTPIFGIGLDASVVPYDKFAANADLCDESVTLGFGQGTQARYEAHGIIYSDDVYKDVIFDLCRAMNARPADLGGQIAIIDNEAKTSVLTLTDKEVAKGQVETYTPKKSRQDLIGGVMGTYQDPNNSYNPADYAPYTDPAWATIDGSVLEYDKLDLDYEIDHRRAQRIAKAYGLKQRRQARLTGVYTLEALRLEDGDWFTRDSQKFGGGKVFEVIGSPTLNTDDMTVTLNAIEVDPSDSAWSSSEEQANDPGTGSGSTPSTAALDPPSVNFQAIANTVGSFTFVGFTFTNNNVQDNVGVEIEISLDAGGGTPSTEVIPTTIPPGRAVSFILSGIFPNANYVIRARAFSGNSSSDWTTWFPATSDPSANYGSGTVDATLGTNVYREDGVTLISDVDVITPLGTALGIQNQGGLATRNDVIWGSDVTGRPLELTDGRIGAGLASNGDLARNIPDGIRTASNILGRSGGGTFTGDLAADITGLNTALGIVGQGWGATAAQSLLDNLYVGVGGNFIIDPDFYLTSTGLHWATDGTLPNRGAQIFNTTDGQRGYHMWSSAATADSQYFRLRTPYVNNNQQQAINVETGDRVGVAVRAGQASGSGVILWIEWRDAAGSWVGSNSVTGNFGVIGDGQGGRESFSPLELYADAPAGAKWAFWAVRGYANTGQALDARIIEPQFVKMNPGQVELPPFVSGPGSQQGADITDQNTALGIVNQGAWATTGLTIVDITRLRAANEGLLNNPFFSDPTYPAIGGIPPDWADWSLGATLTRASRYAGTGYCVAGDATVAGRANLGVSQTPQVIAPNGLYRMRYQARRTGGRNAGNGLLVQWLDSGGNYISGVTLACSQIAPIGGVVSEFQDGLQTWDQIVQAPANAARANVYAMWSWTGMPGYTATDANRFQGEIHEANLYPAGETDRRTNTQSDFADQTIANTALGIVNQGFGATADQNTVDNSYVPLGTNLLYNTKFFGAGSPPLGWEWSGYNTTGLTAVRATNLSASWAGVENVPYVHVPGTPANGTVCDLMAPLNVVDGLAMRPFRVPVIPGERMYFSTRLGAHRCNGVAKAIFYDENGNYVAEASGNTISNNGGGAGGQPENFDNSWGYATVPAGCRWMGVFQRASMYGGANPYLFACQPMVARPPANATGELPFNHGPGDLRADITIDNTASAIANQGGLATGNYYSQNDDPGSVPNGSLWHDADGNELFIRVSNAWVKIANISTGGASFSAQKDSDAYGFIFGAGTCTSNTVTITPSGGVGPYTYQWTVPTGPGIGIVGNLTDNNVEFSKVMAAGEKADVVATCTITDSTGAKASIAVYVYLTST